MFKLVNQILMLCLIFVGSAFAGGMNPGTSDARTVLGKAPAAANGLATLDASSKLVQDAQTVGGKTPAAVSGLATLNAAGALVQEFSPGWMTENYNVYSGLTVSTGMVQLSSNLNLGTRVLGDIFIITTHLACTKGGTAGRITTEVQKVAGGGAITMNAGFTTGCVQNHYAVASEGPTIQSTCFGRVSTAGSLEVAILAQSVGSTCTGANGALYIHWLKKQ